MLLLASSALPSINFWKMDMVKDLLLGRLTGGSRRAMAPHGTLKFSRINIVVAYLTPKPLKVH